MPNLDFEIHMLASTLAWVAFGCLMAGWAITGAISLLCAWRTRRQWRGLDFAMEPVIEARQRRVVLGRE